MRTLASILIFTGTAAMLLTGCGDPVNRQSNPLKDYNELTTDIPISAEQKESHLLCQNPYTVTIRDLNDSGGETDIGPNLQFLNGEPKIYHIYVQSNLQLALSLGDAPKGMDLTEISGTRWDLHWQPSSSDAGNSETVKLIATATNRSACASADIQDLHITTNTGSLQPTIAVTGINSNQPYGPNDRIPFMVTVTDPTLSSTSKPNAPTFEFPTENPDSHSLFLTGKNFVQCGAVQVMPAPWTYRMACAFDADQVVAQNRSAQGLQIVDMVINVKSTQNEAANPDPVKVTINIPPPPATAPTTPTSTETGAGK